MLMHKGIGLEEFNSMTSARAVHALFECCCNVTWAHKVADSRPFASHDELFAMADKQLFALSTIDLDRVFETCIHEQVEFHTAEELARITRARLATMLGPEGGFPTY
ncbi:2-oxo-4-hydroxy-4-carboxy-5-ureidoimidazoline decarboxylase [Aldersonia kunmingensis]|uniref:2-oxo-4-hydroxy-4-carboxy-5-ureidoimidazoline decarboxylase n=1 Tax=Aldersonia kunmingensis TaxID=408066 RepID=UPI0008301BD9|nr:2-oxo-4-hydroxy-4-carboxy-5-ureidoimidazoline decarboxylase [Aldersonia kunmingensis]